ncbi:MAG TPA: hypothetical protein VM053_05020 [Gemmatimonadaceae bacterium]|nr:hypothetical protein [Gemmatimonadaceae bacterium]
MKTSISIAALTLIALAACTADKSSSADSGTHAAANAIEEVQKAAIPPESAPPASATPPDANAGSRQVTPAGIGSVRAGMSVDEANVILNNKLIIPARLEECDYVRPNFPKGLAFMVEKGEISRVEVRPGSDIATVAGAKIGDSEDRIKSLYPGVAVKPHKYTDGHYLVVTPANGGNNRIVFETDGKKVLRYYSGRLPAVEYVEGCS